MRNDDNYYGYHNDYDSGMLYLMEQPALRPLGDAPVWLKHALLMLGGKLLQWVLATVLMFASIIAMGSVLLFALGALGINQAVQQKEMWAWAVVLIVVWFINMLPMVFSAGFVAIAAGVAEDGEFAFRRLFAGFGEQFGQLVKLALFWMLAAFALGMLLGIAKPGSSPWVFLPMVLLFLLCNWMVLPLIMLQGVSPLDAIWMSLVGSLKNIVPLAGFVVVMLSLVFGVWMVAMTGFASFAFDADFLHCAVHRVSNYQLCVVPQYLDERAAEIGSLKMQNRVASHQAVLHFQAAYIAQRRLAGISATNKRSPMPQTIWRHSAAASFWFSGCLSPLRPAPPQSILARRHPPASWRRRDRARRRMRRRLALARLKSPSRRDVLPSR